MDVQEELDGVLHWIAALLILLLQWLYPKAPQSHVLSRMFYDHLTLSHDLTYCLLPIYILTPLYACRVLDSVFKCVGNLFLFWALITWPPLQVSSSRGIFPLIPIFVPSLSCSLLYLLLPQPYSSFAVNSLGNSQLNSFSSSSCSCHLSSSTSSPCSLSNSSTSSFVFSKFFLFSQVSSPAM